MKCRRSKSLAKKGRIFKESVTSMMMRTTCLIAALVFIVKQDPKESFDIQIKVNL